MSKDQNPEMSDKAKDALRELATGITATEGTDNPTLNSDETDPDNNESSRSVLHRSISLESEPNLWLKIAEQQSK